MLNHTDDNATGSAVRELLRAFANRRSTGADQLLRFFGMRRSGNHAVIVWLAHCFENPVHFLNNAVSVANPYVREYQSMTTNQEHLTCFAQADSLDDFHRSHKAALFISYEDIDVTRIRRASLMVGALRVGFPPLQTNTIVIRDPFNLLASRMLDRTRAPGRPTGKRTRELWKAFARVAIGRTGNRLLRPIVADFNRWYESRAYRIELAGNFGLGSTEQGLDDVAPWGDGSSSDGVNYQGRARQMQVLRRYTKVLHEPDFAALMRDESLLELSSEIYPELTAEVLWTYRSRF